MTLRHFSNKYNFGSFLLDWLGTILAMFFAIFLCSKLNNPEWISALFSNQDEIWKTWSQLWPVQIVVPQVLLLAGLIWPVFLILFSVYDSRRNENIKIELTNVFMAVVTSILVITGILYFTYRNTSLSFANLVLEREGYRSVRD